MIVMTAAATACTSYAAEISWETDPSKIPDSEYVQVKDGHLHLNGERVRFWGHIGHFPNPRMGGDRTPADARRELELMVRRMKDTGFNMHRLWHDPKSPYVKGDGSRSDLQAYGIYLLKKHGIKIWYSGLNSLGEIDADRDVDVVDEPATAAAWKEAIRSMAKTVRRGDQIRNSLAAKWDPRLRALTLQRMKQRATTLNAYTGLRYCDDPSVAVWELTNEEWWMPKMTGGQWLKLPKFFQASLIARWHDWLDARYKSDDELAKAWGFLFSGESLKARTVMLAPTAKPTQASTLNDPNPHAQAALTEGVGLVGRENVTEARAADVIAFFMDMLLETKAEQAALVKSLGKSARLSPMVWDTGTGWQIQCQYLHQHADAVTHCTYVSHMHHDPTHKRFPFFSGLEEQPHMCWDVPWVEHNRAPDKPFFVYETQVSNRTKYRAEFPYQVAALGSIQDWDIVCWHSYGPSPDPKQEKPNTRALEVGHSLDLHYGPDEVQLSAMKNAGAIFRNFLLRPAEKPTWFVFGRKMLLHPDSMDYHGSYGHIGRSMLPTTYRHGMRLWIDPALDDNPDHPLFEQKRAERFGEPKDGAERAKQIAEVHKAFVQEGYMTIGPIVKPRIFEASPIRSTNQIAYDWRRGNLTMDAPGVAGFAGFFGELHDPAKGVRFSQAGVTLRDVKVVNPEGMPYPVTPEERYIAFSLASADGKPLAQCGEAWLSLVSTSFNTGFRLNTDRRLPEYHGAMAAEGGSLPVLVARVAGKIESEAIDGMAYTLRDYEMNVIGKGVVRGGELRLSADDAVFFVELRRDTAGRE